MFFCASLLNLCPVNVGLVNVTGINVFTGVMKELGLLTEMVPSAADFGVATNPRNGFRSRNHDSLKLKKRA